MAYTNPTNVPQPEVQQPAAGLIQNAMAGQPAPIPSVNWTAPVQREIDPTKETVSGQLTQLTSQDSPLMQQARTQAKQQMNQRGLLNSSMAVGASQQAAYNAALPLAEADASAYRAAGDYNTQQMNQSLTQRDQTMNQAVFQQLDQSNKLQLADIEASYKTLMQANASAGELYQQSIKNITDITKDPDLNAAAKQAAIEQQTSMLRTGLDMFGKLNNLNLVDLLTFNP